MKMGMTTREKRWKMCWSCSDLLSFHTTSLLCDGSEIYMAQDGGSLSEEEVTVRFSWTGVKVVNWRLGV